MKPKIVMAILMLGVGVLNAAETNAPAVSIPKGVVAASQEQKTFITALAALPLGASQAAVRQALGAPGHTNETSWLYLLDEDRGEGGYYIAVGLTFGTNGLAGGAVSYGHRTLERRDKRE
jgi:hypothetical protein